MGTADDIFDALRRMDAEAEPLANGARTGLRGYYAHRHGAYKAGRGCQWENTWTERLAELLSLRGYECRTQQRYPRRRTTCDLLIRSAAVPPVWIEVKGCWRSVIDNNDQPAERDAPNKSFVKHLHTTAADVAKFDALSHHDASAVALLLIAFDTPDLPITDRDLSIVRGCASGWTEHNSEWRDHAWPGRRVRCWLWHRPLG
jgi:hypothetical protein